jgi:enoyl-CoA hydratase
MITNTDQSVGLAADESNETPYENIRFEVSDNIATLTIFRPDKLNALNKQVFAEIAHCLEKIETTIRGLIITGEGKKAFIAGADISAMSSMSEQEGAEFSALGHQTTLLFETLPIPVVAAVNGFALGGGFEMAMSADFIYASNNAVFGLPETTLGLIPGFGGTQRLVRIVGASKAKELVFTGRNISAAEAEKIGIVSRIFSSQEELLIEAKATLLLVAKNGQIAISAAKNVMNQADDLNIQDGLSAEKNAFGRLFNSDDMHEGVNAFLEKRSANFTGK